MNIAIAKRVVVILLVIVCFWLAAVAQIEHFKTIECCRGSFCPPEKLCKEGCK